MNKHNSTTHSTQRPSAPNTYSMISLGCARNLVDSESMVHNMNQIGFELVPEGHNDSIRILNTCSFIQDAIDETEDNIRQLIDQKKDGAIKHLAIVGCYPSRFKKHKLAEKFPDVDLWLTTKETPQLHIHLNELVFQKKFTPPKPVRYTKLTPAHYAYIKISEGCNNWCTFCTIPKIRGEHTSKPLETIIEEANHHINMGAQELLLIAEDTTAWGEDIYGKPQFSLLLTELAKLPVKWIRPMYIFPSRVDSELIATIKREPNIANYIDMPIQHVDSGLLEGMNRRHDQAFLESILDEMFQEIPDLSLRSTFILGFPGETTEHVHALKDFIQKYRFSNIGCFTYSEEYETKSARYPNKVDPNVARIRVNDLMDTQFGLVQKYHQELVGTSLEVLYEGNGIARSYRDAPDVDGVVIIENGDALDLSIGSFYSARITSHKNYDLIGSIEN